MEAGGDFSQLLFRHVTFEVMVLYLRGDVLWEQAGYADASQSLKWRFLESAR